MNFSRELLYHRHRLSHRQIEELTGEQQTNTAFDEKIKQLKSVSEFLEITASLQKAGIWFVPIKGPLLSYRIYGDVTARRFNDFDFLITPEDLDRTIEVLRLSGYRSGSFTLPEPGHRHNRILKLLDQYNLYHPEKYTSVEIHWKLFYHPCIPYEKMAIEMDKNILQINYAGQVFRQFTIEFELLYLILHGGKHAWTRLKWLVDVKEIVNRFYIDKVKFGQLIKLFRAQRMAGLCNAMLLHFFPGTTLLPVNYKVPGWFFGFCLRQTANETIGPGNSSLEVLKNVWFRMQSFPGWRYKLRILLLFTIRPKDLNRNLVLPYPVFFMIYSLLKYPFKIIKKHITKK